MSGDRPTPPVLICRGECPIRAGARSCPITQFLDNTDFDPEARRVMGVAFEIAHVALGLADRGDLADAFIAKRIIELAKAGERNPDILCERVLNEIRGEQA